MVLNLLRSLGYVAELVRRIAKDARRERLGDCEQHVEVGAQLSSTSVPNCSTSARANRAARSGAHFTSVCSDAFVSPSGLSHLGSREPSVPVARVLTSTTVLPHSAGV